jgi:membrane associated rhomboid family serine protease
MIPIRTDTPVRSTPYMNWVLVAANVVCYALQESLFRGNKVSPLLLNPRDPHIYQYFTYQFLHGSPLHLLGNMVFLWVFGNNVCDKIGQLGYLAFYLAGGVMAGIAHVMTSTAPVLGASGSVSAVTGAYLVLLPRSNVTLIYWWFFIGTFEISGLWLVLIFFALDIVEQVGGGGLFGGREAVAHFAHIGGTVFGATICLLMLWTRLLPRDMFDLLAIWDRWNRRRQHRDAVARGYDPFGYQPRQPVQQRPAHVSDRIQDLRAEITDAIGKHDLEQAAKLYLELRAIDPNQVLARQTQLDVANQLFSQQVYGAAADAYELYLRNYSKGDQIENVHLICGIIYARYLQRYDKAKEHLEAALPRLHAERDVELARNELARIAPLAS